MIKIKISYDEERELVSVMTLLKPILGVFRIKKSNRKDHYKCVYMTPKKKPKPFKQGV